MSLKAPFPWFGGKSSAAPLIWGRLGPVSNYVEPFCGSLATLLARPHPPQTETVNDSDAYISNLWRAIVADPEAVAHWGNWPCNEVDLHARHLWLRAQGALLAARCLADPGYYDPQVAGWWLWGVCLWIGGGWCGPSGSGPWQAIPGADGVPELRRVEDAPREGITRKLPHLSGHRGLASVPIPESLAWLRALQVRLRQVRVCCGDWGRVLGPSVTTGLGLTGVLLDPPYGGEVGRTMGVYTQDSSTVAADVRAWCAANGANPLLRIVLCGYEGEHTDLEALGWTVISWKANGGYGNQGSGRGSANAHRERLWCSPHCLAPQQLALW